MPSDALEIYLFEMLRLCSSEDGTLEAGGAIEIGVRALGLTRGLTWRQYQDQPVTRALSRTYLSLATANSADGDDILAAAGFRMVLLDGADPLMAEGYGEAADRAAAECETLRTEGELEEYATCIEEAYEVTAEEIVAPPWNAAGLVVAGTFVGNFVDKSYGGYRNERVGGWLTYARPVGESGQMGLSGGWIQHLAGGAHELPTIWRLRMGLSRARLVLSGGHVLELGAGEVYSAIPVRFGGEIQVSEDTWLQTEFGVVVEPQNDIVTLLSNFTFQWGQESEPSFMEAEDD